LRQLQQVVSGAEQAPLRSDLLLSPQKKLPKAARLLDLTKDGFDDLLSQSITASKAALLQPPAHSLDPWTVGAVACRGRLAVFLPARRDISTNAAAGQILQILFTAVARVGGNLLGLTARVGTNLIEKRNQLVLVVRAVVERLCDDHLAVGIHRRLRVVALDESVPRLHDAAFRIGEVPLVPILRN